MGHRLCVLSGFLAVFFVLLAILPIGVAQSEAQEVIHKEIAIKPDGSIALDYLCDNGTYVYDNHPNVPISKSLLGDTYTLTGDLYGHLVIEKDGVTLDGAGHKIVLEGYGSYAVSTASNVDKVVIKNFEIPDFGYGVLLSGRNSVLLNVTLRDGGCTNGFAIWDSGQGNTIQHCRVVNTQGKGIYYSGKNGLIYDNYIADNKEQAIQFQSSQVQLKNNVFLNNAWAFGFDYTNLPASSQMIDKSNVEDGKPIYCWVNENDKAVPPEAGYILLNNCTNITVAGASVYSGKRDSISSGIHLYYSQGIIIQGNCFQAGRGINLYTCKNVTVTQNYLSSGVTVSTSENITVTANQVEASSITLFSSKTCIVSKNNITQCSIGLNLEGACKNSFTQNQISNCSLGVKIFRSDDNTFEGNNFSGNIKDVAEQHESFEWPLNKVYMSQNNLWRSNYWSNYTGLDGNSDGIGDIAYLVYEDKIDGSPLVLPIVIPVVVFPQAPITPQPLQPTASLSNQPATPAVTPWLIIEVIVTAAILAAAIIMLGIRQKRSTRKRAVPINSYLTRQTAIR